MTDFDAELPSLELVTAEVDRLVAEQERRSDRSDSLASLLVAFCAALIGLTEGDGTLVICANVATAASASAGIAALLVRVVARPRPRTLRDRYSAKPMETTTLVLLDSKIWLYEQDERRLEHKLARLRVALACLAVGVVLLLGSSLDMAAR